MLFSQGARVITIQIYPSGPGFDAVQITPARGVLALCRAQQRLGNFGILSQAFSKILEDTDLERFGLTIEDETGGESFAEVCNQLFAVFEFFVVFHVKPWIKKGRALSQINYQL